MAVKDALAEKTSRKNEAVKLTKNMSIADMIKAMEPEIKKAIKTIEQRLAMIRQRYEDRQTRIGKKCKEMEERRKKVRGELTHRREGLTLYHQMVENEHLVPDAFLSDDKMKKTELDCQQLLSQLRGTVNQKRESIDKLKSIVVSFNRNFKPQNAFHFNTMPVTDNDYLEIAADLQDFIIIKSRSSADVPASIIKIFWDVSRRKSVH